MDYRHSGCRLYYWRTSAGSEIDFVAYGKDLFWAIEVKNSAVTHPKDFRALKAFGEDYPEAKRFFLYRGKERLIRDNISVEPVGEFLIGLK